MLDNIANFSRAARLCYSSSNLEVMYDLAWSPDCMFKMTNLEYPVFEIRTAERNNCAGTRPHGKGQAMLEIVHWPTRQLSDLDDTPWDDAVQAAA